MSFIRSPSLRWFVLAALAVVAVAVSGGLALEAWRATERHRAAAEGALRDHAMFAALAFRERVIGRAWVAVDAIFRPVGHARMAPSTDTLPPLDLLRRAAEDVERCGQCGPDLRPRYYFRLILADTSLEVDGRPLSAERRANLLAGVNHPRVREWREWDYTSIVDTVGPETELVYLSARRGSDGRPVVVYGFAVELERVAATMLRPALAGFPLLPVPHLADLPNDSLLSVTMIQPDGPRALDLSPRRHPDDYSSRIHASRLLGGWSIRVALDPRTAPRLLLGGLPSSRTPLLAAMVSITAVLIASTIFAAWRALELARLRAEFVASVSHELRTPLAQILLFGESLTLGRMQARRDVRAAGRVIVGEARRLLQLVDNVLLFGRAARTSPVSATPEPLAPLLREVVTAFSPVASAAESHLLSVRLDEVTARIDRSAIRQVVLNLLDNAIKYGPRGQTVSLGLALAGGRARLWVEDEGPGIPPADRARVWRPFVRLSRDIDGQTAGSGIGLSLVRDIVSCHRGSAWIESTPAGGTRVVVELPDARAIQPEPTCAS